MENNAFYRSRLKVFCIPVSSGFSAPAAGSLFEQSPASAQAVETAWTEAPLVGNERLQERIDKAWQKAAAGENPASTCAGIKGRAAALPNNPAPQRAAFVCSVEIPVRYFRTLLDQVEADEKSCSELMMAIATQLGAMTISAETVRKMAESTSGAGGESEAWAVATATLDAAIREAATEQGSDDPNRLVKDRLTDRTRAVCPDVADVILR